MWPCLLLALALLGTVPGSLPGFQAVLLPRQHSGRCPWAQVNAWCQPMPVPQSYCQNTYRGQLASVHSSARNQELQKQAQTYHLLLAPWIGAVTSRRAGKWESYWEDSSPWNYANWAPTQPLHIVTTCTTLSVRDGLWRSRFCFQLRPFICQY
ncbi:PRG3 protein, partial [Rhadina sibilatrix]|nr:PRG3 protein [Rhadina sibilatrix]